MIASVVKVSAQCEARTNVRLLTINANIAPRQQAFQQGCYVVIWAFNARVRLCVVNETLDHWQGLSCEKVTPQWAFWPLTRKELRADQYTPAKTNSHTQTHMI